MFGNLNFGHWNLFDIWILGFGILDVVVVDLKIQQAIYWPAFQGLNEKKGAPCGGSL